MPASRLADLSRASGTSVDWIIFGIEAATSSETIPKMENESPEPPDTIQIPVLNVVGSAGPGAHNGFVEVLSHIPFSRTLLRRYGVRIDKCHFIRAVGDSMLPTIADGTVVLVDGGVRRVRDDGIYVLVLDDDVRLKRVQRQFGGTITLKSDNPAYAPETLSAADAEQLRVVGKVFWMEHPL